MNKPHVFIIILLFFPGLTGLSAQQPKAPNDRQMNRGEGGENPPARVEAGAEHGTYVIGAEDVLDVSVWQEKDISRTVPVRPDGRISIPLVNDIQAEGLTPMQLADSITEKLKKFLTKPQVTVTVVAVNSQLIFVVGEVNRPGPMSLLPKMTALQAVSTAGGVSQFADQKHAYVMRHEGGKDLTLPLNYRDLLRGDLHGNVVLKAGDTIVVP